MERQFILLSIPTTANTHSYAFFAFLSIKQEHFIPGGLKTKPTEIYYIFINQILSEYLKNKTFPNKCGHAITAVVH